MVREMRSEIRIRASAERVWDTLTDFSSYPAWNPFIREVSGPLAPGSRIRVRLQRTKSSTMTFRPRVLTANRPRELRWLGRLGIPGLFDGEHSFTITPAEGGEILFAQAESFRGILVPLLWRSLQRDTKPMFDRMNDALRTRAEAPELAAGERGT